MVSPVVDEPLLAVHDPGEVDAGLRVLDQLPVALLGKGHREGGRRDDVAVARGPGRVGGGVHGVGGPDRGGERRDARRVHGIRATGRVGASREVSVDGHGDHSMGTGPAHDKAARDQGSGAAVEAGECAQRVSRCTV